MSNRKVLQEIEKCFKQVATGVEAFDEAYQKYEQSTNASQRDKLVDQIKKECKKLQRLRDQIKTWAAGNEVKDKTQLQDKRELIETKMEAFKAVEKEMKTKAFSKEGLLASQKLDPHEQEKMDTIEFLHSMIESLSGQLEAKEAEIESLHSQVKKAKKDTSKAERLGELEHVSEQHKWHIGRLELLLRAVDNDGVEPEQVRGAEEDIRNYVDNNQEVDFMEDDGIYDEFNLDSEESRFGAVHHDTDKASSQDNPTETESLERVPSAEASKPKSKSISESTASHRRPSQHIKSPLPTLATLHTTPSTATTTTPNTMKPAPPPSKPPGEPLKYASAAAAAAASDKAGIGIAPLPAPPSTNPLSSATAYALAPTTSVKSSSSTSPAAAPAVPEPTGYQSEPRASTSAPHVLDKQTTKSPTPSQSSISVPSPAVSAAQLAEVTSKEEAPPLPTQNAQPVNDPSPSPPVNAQNHDREQPHRTPEGKSNGVDHDEEEQEEEEPIYHLPSSLQELIGSYEAVKEASLPVTTPAHQKQLAASFASRPDTFDAERPHHYKPQNPAAFTPNHWPQEPLPIFDDARLYEKIDTDSLFYSFYYRQGTYQQFLAAKALKSQSWRFHKQYQTWFQRHEEPKNITEDFEQGTYRFFDYESTWYAKPLLYRDYFLGKILRHRAEGFTDRILSPKEFSCVINETVNKEDKDE